MAGSDDMPGIGDGDLDVTASPSGSADGGDTRADAGEAIHRPIGPYYLVQKIGEGGFGEVYVAAQVEPVKRRVALKILKAGMDTKAVLARFEAERQVLAAMSHPNIARILDAGATEGGRPYFVMELVRGEPLTRYCDRYALTTRQRLELFVSICHAVQHAHQRGIIHRDLKPSNILVEHVDGAPLPKIIDFGIAKARGVSPGEGTITFQGDMLGTPEYMSPEQAESGVREIDTRTDVYSLGVVLYEILSGSRPIESATLRAHGLGEIPRVLREAEAPRPSTRVATPGPDSREIARKRHTDARTLTRQLRGDLDWITLKSIEKEPDRRYGSPAELAADVLRYLHDEPVLARPPSLAYRFRKFARRRRALVVGTTAFLVAALAGVGATAWQAVRATRAEKTARAEAALSAAVNKFLLDMLASANPERNPEGRSVTVAEVVDRAAATIDELEVEPAVRARIRATIGSTYRELGDYPQAETQLRAALATRRDVLAPDDPEIGDSLDELGELLWMQGKYDEIPPLWEESLRIRESRPGPDDLPVATCLNNLAALALSQGRFDDAGPLFERSLAIRRRILGDQHESVAESLSNLAVLRSEQGRPAEAEEKLRESLAIYRKVLGDESLQVATLLDNLAVTVKQDRRLEEAEPLYREALAIREKALGHEHLYVAGSLNNLGRLLQAQKKWEEAEELLREALAIRRRLLGEENPHTSESLANLGYFYRDAGRLEEADETLRAALAAAHASLGPDHPRIANIEVGRASILVRTDRAAEALPLVRDALRIRTAKLPADHPLLGVAHHALGSCLLALGRTAEAEPALLEADRILATAEGEERATRRMVLRDLEELYGQKGDVAQAEKVRAALDAEERTSRD